MSGRIFAAGTSSSAHPSCNTRSGAQWPRPLRSLKGVFAYHAACSQMMDDFKPGADGTHNVCAVGHCGDELRALLMCDGASGTKCPLVYCRPCLKNYDKSEYDGIALKKFCPLRGSRSSWQCPVCQGTPLHEEMAWPNMLTLLTGRDKFVSDRLREERGAAAGRQSTGSEEEEGGGGGRGALPSHG